MFTIVPDYVHDAINALLDRELARCPSAAADRDYLYGVLLDHFDRNGVLPAFELRPTAS